MDDLYFPSEESLMERWIDGRREMWVRAQGMSGLPLRGTRHWLPEDVFRVTEALSVLPGKSKVHNEGP